MNDVKQLLAKLYFNIHDDDNRIVFFTRASFAGGKVIKVVITHDNAGTYTIIDDYCLIREIMECDKTFNSKNDIKKITKFVHDHSAKHGANINFRGDGLVIFNNIKLNAIGFAIDLLIETVTSTARTFLESKNKDNRKDEMDNVIKDFYKEQYKDKVIFDYIATGKSGIKHPYPVLIRNDVDFLIETIPNSKSDMINRVLVAAMDVKENTENSRKICPIGVYDNNLAIPDEKKNLLLICMKLVDLGKMQNVHLERLHC
jgi:hypothetical protein